MRCTLLTKTMAICYFCNFQKPRSAADPGFPVGGRGPRRRGAWTPEAATFRKICMSKRKNWVRQCRFVLHGRAVSVTFILDPAWVLCILKCHLQDLPMNPTFSICIPLIIPC